MAYTYLCPQGLHLPSLCLLLRVPRGSRAAVGLSRTDLCLQWVHDWNGLLSIKYHACVHTARIFLSALALLSSGS